MRYISWALAAVALAAVAPAQPLPAPKSGISLERLNSYPLIHGRSPAGAQLSPDGSKIIYGWNTTGERRLDVYVMDVASGSSRRILESTDFPEPPRQEDRRSEEDKKEQEAYEGGVGNFQWSPDSKTVMTSYRGRTWLYNPDGSNLRPLMDTSEQFSQATFSPDGNYIAFLRGGNLYRMDLRNNMLKQLTYITGAGNVDGFSWAPDSQTLGVTWSDNSRMGRHVMMDFTKQRAEVVNISRMWNGDRPVNNQIGVVNVDGGKVDFVKGLPRYMWVTSMDWSPDGQYLAIAWIKEDFKEFTVTVVSRKEAWNWTAYHETAPNKYIPDFRNVAWTRDNRLLFTTDIIDGKWAYRSVMSTDAYGRDLKAVYAKDHDVVAMHRPSDSDRLFLVTMKRGGTITEMTILEPNGRETEHMIYENGVITPTAFDEATNPMVSDNGRVVVTMPSKPGSPPDLWQLEPRERRLTTSQTSDEFKKIEWVEPKRVQFRAPDGKMVGASLYVPKDAKPGDKRPAVVSGIYANSAKLSWGGYNENYMVTELGMVVLTVDFRASWGYGGEFNAGYHESMGLVDSDEAVAAKEYLASLDYVNPDRIGIWGWSYGGYLTCMVMTTKAGVYDTGVAVASVTDWRQYNEWYTRRRLGLVSENEEIFKKTSPVTYTDQLAGNLYLIHGMLDDNVLLQDTVQLMEGFIKNGKHFDVMMYPRANHSIGRIEERPHVFSEITRYLYWKLNRPANEPAVQPMEAKSAN